MTRSHPSRHNTSKPARDCPNEGIPIIHNSAICQRSAAARYKTGREKTAFSSPRQIRSFIRPSPSPNHFQKPRRSYTCPDINSDVGGRKSQILNCYPPFSFPASPSIGCSVFGVGRSMFVFRPRKASCPLAQS